MFYGIKSFKINTIVKKLLAVFICVCAIASACREKNLNDPDGPVIVNPDDIIVNKNEVLDDEVQKEKLEQVAFKLMDVFEAKEYKDLIELSEVMFSHCDNYFADEDYDWSDLEDALEDIGETLYDERQKNDRKWEYTYTLFLSNCTGILTFDKDKVTFKESNEIKVIIKDVKGDDWEAVVKPKGLKKVFLGEFIDTYYDYYYGEEYTDIYNVTVEIPSSLSLEVKKNGKFFANAEVKFDYSISEDGLDVEKDRIGVEVDLKIDDLTLTLKKASYNASNGNFEYSLSFRKGDIFIFSQSISANAEIDIQVEDDEVYVNDWDGSVDFQMNILGEIQIKGSCNDLNKLSSYLEDELGSVSEAEKVAEKASRLVDLGIYYDGTSTKQARIAFEVVVEEDFFGEYYWIEPVLEFSDGTRYFFYDYFDDRIFENLVDDFQDFIYDYEDMVEDIY